MIKITVGTKENPVRFSYANVHQPVSVNGSDLKYSVSIIIPKSDKKVIKKIKDAIQKATQENKDKFGGKVPSNLKNPLRNGDTDREDDEAYADSFFINANSKIKPGIVDADLNPIMDQSEFYSGCYGRVSLTFYAYNVNGNKGIAAGLQNIMKTDDGDPLGGRSSAEADFADDSDDDDDILG
ncbi:DUF2815 family protein [Bacillus aquiflavi]|uniref:DUF2815 family protein n=1 Tax=Bacillus aquiflavi TaxID=2672567 RepID=A0A6B3VX26_9BACI|nr:DUF2815 family protein [Bacillus aquiflavi]MBA4538457.1 DUF2815 family protein [Bacillus aquiflavi]NEY82820.1 DUF2815 family protein [Bacillus aquiflavi]UAC48668.1 DUF2815 family protein [Bacillus aquiflavi]